MIEESNTARHRARNAAREIEADISELPSDRQPGAGKRDRGQLAEMSRQLDEIARKLDRLAGDAGEKGSST
jgi:hypothetical protein